jgi:hypothetical protein
MRGRSVISRVVEQVRETASSLLPGSEERAARNTGGGFGTTGGSGGTGGGSTGGGGTTGGGYGGGGFSGGL